MDRFPGAQWAVLAREPRGAFWSRRDLQPSVKSLNVERSSACQGSACVWSYPLSVPFPVQLTATFPSRASVPERPSGRTNFIPLPLIPLPPLPASSLDLTSPCPTPLYCDGHYHCLSVPTAAHLSLSSGPIHQPPSPGPLSQLARLR